MIFSCLTKTAPLHPQRGRPISPQINLYPRRGCRCGCFAALVPHPFQQGSHGERLRFFGGGFLVDEGTGVQGVAPLLTRNGRDFVGVAGLVVLDPHEAGQ